MSIFGVDSCGAATVMVPSGGTDVTFYDWVKSQAGAAPTFWGRYLVDSSCNLTASEADFLLGKGCYILVIYGGATANSVSTTDGTSDANAAISAAKSLNVPSGVALFADVEPEWTPTSTWIKGWMQTLQSEGTYASGFYADTSESAFNTPFCEAFNTSFSPVLWAQEPKVGCTSAGGRPAWDPDAPSCFTKAGNEIAFWQYGNVCYSNGAYAVDLDEWRDDTVLPVLWAP